MLKEKRTPRELLFSIAEGQQGYFTTSQAREAGYQDATHPYHVRTGEWVREWRGIYRLALFPNQPESHYVLWALWSRDRKQKVQGVFSHQTALSMHDLTDVMPAKIHLTVPESFRRSAPIPGVLVLHRGSIPEFDRETRQGFTVTRTLRTLLDVLESGRMLEPELLAAGKEALKRGVITPSELRRRRENPQWNRFVKSLRNA
jgi:predicted transcriptional regulator of viral defense system